MQEQWNWLSQLMTRHYSVRKYKDEPIPKERLHQMIRAAQHASSSNFLQAYSIVHVTDQRLKQEMATWSQNPQQVLSAPVFLLFCADVKRLEHAGQKHGAAVDADTVETLLVAVVDTALMAQNVALAAEAMGYGICYIGGVRNHPAEISQLVQLPDKVFPLFGMTIGVPDEQHEVKPRLMLEAVLHENRYDETKYPELLDQYDDVMARYYNQRSANRKQTNWTETVAAYFSEERRLHMRDFLASKGFLLR